MKKIESQRRVPMRKAAHSHRPTLVEKTINMNIEILPESGESERFIDAKGRELEPRRPNQDQFPIIVLTMNSSETWRVRQGCKKQRNDGRVAQR